MEFERSLISPLMSETIPYKNSLSETLFSPLSFEFLSVCIEGYNGDVLDLPPFLYNLYRYDMIFDCLFVLFWCVGALCSIENCCNIIN